MNRLKIILCVIAWGCATLSLAGVVTLFAFHYRAGMKLGRTPVSSGMDDPKSLGLDDWYEVTGSVLEAGFYTTLVLLILVPVLTCIKTIRPHTVQLFAFGGSALLYVFTFFSDAMAWYLD